VSCCYNFLWSVQKANLQKFQKSMTTLQISSSLSNCTCPKPNSTETRHTHVMLEMLLEIQEWEIYQPKGLVT
jgi:hypothetical protein